MEKGVVRRTSNNKRATSRALRSGNGSRQAPFRLVTRRQIRTVADRLVHALQPEKIILFGSYAYGKPTVDSDVDLLIVMHSNERPAKRAYRAFKAIWGKTFPMDILVLTPEELKHRLEIDDYFIQEIIERGKVLYDRRNDP